ncbi:Stf0 family sulfotransferase [Actibacterium sp. D379-3]
MPVTAFHTALLTGTNLNDPVFDQPPGRPAAGKKLLLCAPPRSASTTLARALALAGLGIPEEYFNRDHIPLFSERWQVPTPTGPDDVAPYMAAAMDRRSRNGVFASKLQFWQFREFLTGDAGKELFEGATVLFLLRENLTAQAISFAMAMQTRNWNDDIAQETDEDTAQPPGIENLKAAQGAIINELSGWNRFFMLSGIHPLILTDRQVAEDLPGTITQIAGKVGVTPDLDAVQAFTRTTAGYRTHRAEKKMLMQLHQTEFAASAFDADSYRPPSAPKKKKPKGIAQLVAFLPGTKKPAPR